jgi:hypothetical protein
MKKAKASQARKEIAALKNQIDNLISRLISQRKEIIPGKVTAILTKCGKPGCKCAAGQRHLSHFLYVARGGPLKRIYLPKKDLHKVGEASERYRRYRSDRAGMAKVFKQLLARIDQLEKALTGAYDKEVER